MEIQRMRRGKKLKMKYEDYINHLVNKKCYDLIVSRKEFDGMEEQLKKDNFI